MILQALCEYYQRKKSFGKEQALSPRGYEPKEIPFIIVIDDDGKFVALLDTRHQEGKKLVGKFYPVPKGKIRSGSRSYETANLLWDHFGYLLGQPKQEKPDVQPSAKDIEMASRQHQFFIALVNKLAKNPILSNCQDLLAVQRFLKQRRQINYVKKDPLYKECLKIKGCNMTFQRVGKNRLCCQSAALRKYIEQCNKQQAPEADSRICLVTGKHVAIARLHDGIGHITGKPVPLASINADAFESYGKEQGFNFPVGKQAVFEYTTALNDLLKPGSTHKIFLARTTMVCWSEKQHALENDLPKLFGSHNSPERDINKVIDHYRSIASGDYQSPDNQQRFYVLGLAPNPPARIVVRFWLTGTVAGFSRCIGQWFNDIEVEGVEKWGYPSLYDLMLCTATLNKADNIPGNQTSEVYLSILQGLPLPDSLLTAVIRRIKATRGHVRYEHACLLKACLNGRYRHLNKMVTSTALICKELTVSLNPDDKRIGYRLGRLFAAYEKLQMDAHEGSLNATIRDHYYSSASSTPVSVFGTLDRLSTHHLKKLNSRNPAWGINAEKLIGQIMEGINAFPAHLDLEGQGLFAIGYYHQRQAFFTKKSSAQELRKEEGVEA